VPRFLAELKRRGPGNFVDIPFDPGEVFGEARPPVRGTVNGYAFRGRIAKYGGKYMLGFKRELREGAEIEEGDVLDLDLELDTEPREVDVPADLKAAFDDEAWAAFERMSYTHRKEYADWIEEAKRPETRARRVAKAVEMIREGKTQR
jgi:Bacteriocin-protection, YdeI or OmpD-Associated/Domain of unknown function (DUF1905)